MTHAPAQPYFSSPEPVGFSLPATLLPGGAIPARLPSAARARGGALSPALLRTAEAGARGRIRRAPSPHAAVSQPRRSRKSRRLAARFPPGTAARLCAAFVGDNDAFHRPGGARRRLRDAPDVLSVFQDSVRNDSWRIPKTGYEMNMPSLLAPVTLRGCRIEGRRRSRSVSSPIAGFSPRVATTSSTSSSDVVDVINGCRQRHRRCRQRCRRPLSTLSAMSSTSSTTVVNVIDGCLQGHGQRCQSDGCALSIHRPPTRNL